MTTPPRSAYRSLLAAVAFLAALALGSLASAAPPSGSAAPAQADAPLDRTTPRRTLEGFLRAVRAGDDARAAQYFDLRALPRGKQAEQGPKLAHQLGLVLAWKLVIDPATISDDPEGDPSDGPGTDLVGTLELDGEPAPIALSRVRLSDAPQTWLFSKTTVAMAPALFAMQKGPWIGDHLPEPLARLSLFEVAAWQWIGIALCLVASYAAGFVVGTLFAAIGARLAKRSKPSWDDELVKAARGPLRLVLGVLAFDALVPALRLDASAQLVLDHGANTVLILAVAWLVFQLIHLGATSLETSLPGDTAGDLRTRGLRTQIAVLRRVASVLVGILAAAAVLTQFEVVRTVGTSLLASAGIAGVVLGIAAQKTLGGLIAGIQVSITQPIRIGDTVVVDQEQGTIEEINLTYVVVKLWDDRRLIVPTARFLEQPFQNWTRRSAEILGTVLLPVDYTTPLDLVRAELQRLCGAHPAWDGRVCKLQVSEAGDKTMTLRVVVSAANADKSSDLRSDLREGLVRFLRDLDSGKHLPKQRFDGNPGAGDAPKA